MILAFVLLASGLSRGETDRATSAPDFRLAEVGTGETVSLSDFRGRIVFINFFNEGCLPCRDEVPFLNLLSKKYPEELVVLGIGYDVKKEMRLLGSKERMDIEFSVLLDGRGLVARAYRVWSLPAGYLVNERGEIVRKYFGRVEKVLEADVEKEVARLRDLKANRSVWVEDFGEVTKAAQVQELGAKVRAAVIESLGEKGYPLAEKKADAGFIIRGSVSGLGLMSGVNIQIIRKGSRKPVEEFSMVPPDNDFSLVAGEILKRMEKW